MTAVLRRALVICAIVTVMAGVCHGEGGAVRIFGGLARTYHSPDSAIVGTSLASATAVEVGAGLRGKRVFFDLAYLGAGHEMVIGSDKVPLSFRSLVFRLGCDLTVRTAVVPFVTVDYGLSHMTDTEGDGFKAGNALGVGAGARCRVGRRGFLELALVYEANSYGTFEVTRTPWVDQENVKLNRLTIDLRLGFLIPIATKQGEGAQ